jgi:hypothetical protein
MEITNSKLSNYILYSNKNLEKLCRSLINESANAVLLESYNDKLLMADHNSGAIYLADYNFDGKTLTVENYEQVEVVNDKAELREAINNYFQDDGYDVAAIAEAYENDSEANNTELNESIVEALASKRNDVANYTELYGINEEIGDVADMPFFKRYQEYLTESPTSSIKFFDWETPVKVSIIDEDEDRTIVANAKAKAEVLSKDKTFKEAFMNAAAELLEGDSSLMEEVLEENSVILALEDLAFKEFVGKALVADKDLFDNKKAILEAIEEIVSESEYLSESKMLFEEDEGGEEGADASLETSDKDIDALKDALDKALDKITDEKLVSKINALKDALDTSKDSGATDVGTVKECVELLSF